MSRRMAFLHLPPIRWLTSFYNPPKKDFSASLADLYNPDNLNNIEIDLKMAHEANDKAVLKAYGLKPSATEAEIVQYLFKMYAGLTKDEKK